MKKIHKFGLINLIALVIIVIVLSFVPIAIVSNNKNNLIEDYYKTDNNYNGIIEIWNIDTFEGGTTSKEFYLSYVAKEFMNKYKGTYVHISNLTVDGLISELNMGKLPDLFSFGNGIGEFIIDKLKTVNIDDGILSNLLNSGKINNEQLAVPYMYGGYFVFSTSENLEKTGNMQTEDILHNYNNFGYKKTSKKVQVIVPSISYGETEFISPLASLYYENGCNKTGLSTKLSPYEAYSAFSGYNASTLYLGNHRDLARFINREKLGKISGLIINPIGAYTDLVQYLGVSKQDNELRENLATDFIKLCINKENQLHVSEIGMLSVNQTDLYKENEYAIFERSFNTNTIIPNAFETSEDRIIRKNKY